MERTLKILLGCVLVTFSAVVHGQVTSSQNGDYSANSTWVGNSPNEKVEDVLILHDVVLDVNLDIRQDFEVQGSLTGTAGNSILIQDFGDMTIGSLNMDDLLEIKDDGNLTVKAGDTVYVQDLILKSDATLTVEAGGVVYVSRDFHVRNNSSAVIDGEVHVAEGFEVKNAGNIAGNGYVYANGTVKINSTGSVFGSSEECPGCVYHNGCVLGTVTTDWTGVTNSDWTNPGNWSNGVPTAKTPATILGTATNMPTISTVGAAVFHLTIESGATLTIAGTNSLDIEGNLRVQGTFVPNQSTVNFNSTCWSSVIDVSGGVQFYSLTINNTQDVTMNSGSYSLVNTLTISQGSLITNDSLTLISDASGTARIAEITGTGISGQIVMERYIDAGETYWRYFGSAVSGATLAQFNDDFTTAGYPGSLFPNFGWVSAYNYDETLGAGLGYLETTGASQVMGVGEGWQIWCGDTITGTQPFTFDLRGTPNQGNINLPVTFTNYGLPAEDGFNMVCNPYASTIDWDDVDWTKTNMANAVYIQDPDNQQYATYIAGASTNGGSRYIASQQSFWVQAVGASPVLQATEGVKSDVDAQFIKAGNVSAGMKITLHGNEQFDEVVVRDEELATTSFDAQWDARKFWGGWGLYPQFSLLDPNNEDMTIHSFDKGNQDWQIPLRAIVFSDGDYSISFSNIAEMDVPCMVLEDTYDGNTYPVYEGAVYTFFMDDSTYAPRFILHVGRSYDSQVQNTSCFGDNDGLISLDLDLPSNTNYNLTVDQITTSENGTADPLVLSNLSAGIYEIEVPSLVNMCGHQNFFFVVNQPSMIDDNSVVTEESFGFDGEIQSNIFGGVQPYSYSWDNGASTADLMGLTSGDYELIVTDANGCEFTKLYTVGSVVSVEVQSISTTSFYFDQSSKQIVIVGALDQSQTTFNLYNSSGQLINTYQLVPELSTQSVGLPVNLAAGVYVFKGINDVHLTFKFQF